MRPSGSLQPLPSLILKKACAVEDEGGWRLLDVAAQNGQAPIVALVIEKMDKDAIRARLNLPNRFGWTPLDKAAEKGRAGVVELLLRNNADPNHHAGTQP